MTKKSICGGEKYFIGGPNEDVIGLKVHPVSLPETIEVENHTLSLKSDFHVTLLIIGNLIEKNKALTPNFIKKVINYFCEFTHENRVNLLKYTGEFRFVAQNDRRAIIAMCDVSNLKNFYDLLNQKYKTKIEYPPTHVTLYTLQPNAGIFLTDLKDIYKLTKVIDVPITLNI